MTAGRDLGSASRQETSFSVIVPCFNAESTIQEVLDALAALHPPPKEIIVVDDHSEDASVEACSRSRFRVIVLERHGGVSVARNRGARAATGDILVFVDSDILVPPDLLENLAAKHRDQPEYVGFSVLPDPDFARGGFFSQFLNRRMHHGFSNLRTGVTTLCTSCASVRADVFDEVGGFDEAGTCAVNDEATLGWRLAERGLKTAVLEDAVVRHLKRMTIGAWRRKFFDEGRQWVVLVGRHKSRHRSDAPAKLTLQFRRPFNVALIALMVVSLATAPWAGIAAFAVAAALLGLFFAFNFSYLTAMSRQDGPVWFVGAALMVVLEAALHLIGLSWGAVTRVVSG